MEHGLMRWYSSFTTGIFEVDNQHGNIDQMIQLISSDPNTMQRRMKELEQAIQVHFSYEENLLGDAFPREHFQEHRRLEKTVTEQIKFVIDGWEGLPSFKNNLNRLLIEHVQGYDMALKELLPKELGE